MSRILFGTCLLLALLAPRSVQANVVFPARLDLVEIDAGVFRVTLQLPLINGRYPKAEVLLPGSCAARGDRVQTRRNNVVLRSWITECGTLDWYGQVIQIRGLQGTNVDVMLQVDLLEGRSYTHLLRPGRSAYTIPVPPGWLNLAGGAVLQGLRLPLQIGELYLLLLLLSWMVPRSRPVRLGLFALGVGFGLALWLGQRAWLDLWAGWGPLMAMGIASALALRLHQGTSMAQASMPEWLIGGWLLGLLLGAGRTIELTIEGLTALEQGIGLAGQIMGLFGGIAIIYWLWRFLFDGLRGRWPWLLEGIWRKGLAMGLGILSTGLGWYWASSLILLPGLWPPWPPAFWLALMVAACWLGARSGPWFGQAAGAFLLALVAGLTLGAWQGQLPGMPVWAPLGLAAAGFFWLVPGRKVILAGLSAAALAIVFSAVETGSFIQQNLSLPIAQRTGSVILAASFGWVGYRLAAHRRFKTPPLSYLPGLLVLVGAVWLASQRHLHWWQEVALPEWANGQILLPVWSLGLLVGAILVWPRPRRMADRLGLRRQRPTLHWLLLGLSFFLLPAMPLSVPNPWRSGPLPQGEQAFSLVQDKLRQTYFAFNIENEEALFDELARSVSRNLIASMYLDSRRRLASGLQEGAEVSVREVRLVDLEEGAGGSAYACTWTVTARVRHLQHVHHRRNLYIGQIELTPEANTWKINRVALQREDRTIVPAPTR